jgi:biopolymer transport protein ExbD
MAVKPPKAFDVWFVAANTVYRQVPYQVVADWTGQGRLAPVDMLRPAGTEEPWKRDDGWELFADYLPKPAPAVAAVGSEQPAATLDVHEHDDFLTRRRRPEEDDEVDMIPLIDISMVLLVFFIIVSATGALSPVDVPDMRYAGELSQDADAITISIEKASDTEVYYSVRTGPSPPLAEHAKLATPEAALAALDSLLPDRTRPPNVQIACAKDLPSERVVELARELKKRMDARKINSFAATVNEAPKK